MGDPGRVGIAVVKRVDERGGGGKAGGEALVGGPRAKGRLTESLATRVVGYAASFCHELGNGTGRREIGLLVGLAASHDENDAVSHETYYEQYDDCDGRNDDGVGCSRGAPAMGLGRRRRGWGSGRGSHENGRGQVLSSTMASRRR